MSDLNDDIEKYLKGELSSKEMHELEKKALSDPFLADALEGGSSIDHNEFSKDVEALNKKIHRQKSYVVLRIAAGVILLISVGLFFVLKNEKKQEIVVNRTDTVKTELPKQQEQITLSTEKPPIKRKSVNPRKDQRVESPVVTSILQEHDTTTTVVKVEPPPVVIAKNTHVVSGSVTTKEDNLPLPGVTVLIKGTTRGTTTDINGNYSLEVADTSSLVFSFVGMQTNEVVADQKADIDVKMNEDISQLSEVVIARTALPSDDDNEEGPIVRLAQPVGGVRAYNKYLESNKQYPQQALENDVKGRVIVGFDVRSDGTLSNFKVIRSLGFGCDEEVLRLVREGAAWHPTTEDNKPVESTVHVKMKFDAVKYKKRKR